MLRKTILIDEHLYIELEKEGILDSFHSFSDLVSFSLGETIESIKKETYRKQIKQMVNDRMVTSDITEIMNEFKYSDGSLEKYDR